MTSDSDSRAMPPFMDSSSPQHDSVHSASIDLAAPPPRVAFDPADRFIPLRAGDLAAALVDDSAKFGLRPEDLAAVFRGIGEALSRQAAAWERSIADLYSPFNPDRETRLLHPRSRDCTPEALAQLRANIARLFDKANFEELDAANSPRRCARRALTACASASVPSESRACGSGCADTARWCGRGARGARLSAGGWACIRFTAAGW